MDLIEKKLTLSDLLEIDRIDTDKMQLRRAIIQRLKREIATEEGSLPSIVKDENNVTPNREHIKSLIIEFISKSAKPLRLNDIQTYINNTLNTDNSIREFLRTMQNNKKLALMKINDNNRLSYWVKPEWIDRENNTLYDQYRVDIMTENLDDKLTFE